MSPEQLPLFPPRGRRGEFPEPELPSPALNADSPLSAAITGFHQYMLRQGFTQNTINSFLGDLRIFGHYIGLQRSIGHIGTKDLKDFLAYLLYQRGKPCNPKSYARRLTTLKVFFRWLTEEGVIPADPAAPIAHRPVTTPLPHVLYQAQVERLLAVTENLRRSKPDARPHLLITLLLATGIKKGECMAIRLQDIDLSDPQEPVLYIRYTNPKMKHKERKLRLPPEFPALLAEYLEQYRPKERLFECTARNLEYVLHEVAEMAGLKGGLSFETLRWTAALRDYKAGMPPDKLRRKLGLSRISWREVEEKLKKLAAAPL